MDSYRKELFTLIRAFHFAGTGLRSSADLSSGKIDPDEKMQEPLLDKEDTLELWYPTKRQQHECAIAGYSFFPLMHYYFQKLSDWGLAFLQCQRCGDYFVADNKHYKYCKSCKKPRDRETKKQYDDKVRQTDYERAAKNGYQYWYSRMKKIRKNPGVSQQRLAEYEAAFKSFLTEMESLKKKVKNDTLSEQEFRSWLLRQRSIVDHLVSTD